MDTSEKRSGRPKARQSLAHIPSRTQSEAFDRQNATTDLSVLDRAQEQQTGRSKKRTRGKSLGPGGLEALKETSGNAGKKVASFQPRSILTPSIPLTPPKKIPTFDELRKRTASAVSSTSQGGSEDLLIDFSTPGQIRPSAVAVSANEAHTAKDPFSPIRKVSKAIDHQTIALQDDGNDDEEEASRHKAAKKAIIERRAARRKSMANTRVSFAPEATLHTWSVMELQEDSTTSSASNSTRRQSSMTAAQSPALRQGKQPDETPSTPPEQVDEPVVKASPAQEREPHQKRRRSSISTDMDLGENSPYSSSPSGDLTTDSSPVRVEDSMDSDSDDDDGDTAMSIDDTTSHTLDSQESATQSSLDERLRQAANQAGTRGIDYDEHGDDLSMEMADGTVTSAFQPWAHSKKTGTNTAAEDQENINSFSPAQKAKQPQSSLEQGDDGDEDDLTGGMTMDMTQAVGRIVQPNVPSARPARKSVGSRRRSSMARRQSSGHDTSYEDETMDFTTVGGGILAHGYDSREQQDAPHDDDVTMEFTTAVGGVQNPRGITLSTISPSAEDNDTMDMTAAVGGILATIEEHTEPQTDVEDDRTAAMDMTRAVGHIITPANDEDTVLAELQMQNEMTEAASVFEINQNVERNNTTHHLTAVTSETGSPSLALKPRLSARSKAGSASRSTTPKSTPRTAMTRSRSSAAGSTPEKQITPVPQRSRTPEKIASSGAVNQRSASPKKLFAAEMKARSSPSSARKSPAHRSDPLFSVNDNTGQQTPKYVLHAPKPHQHLRRRSSGVGIDKEGMGSPRVAELLDCRSSIGDAAPSFKLDSAPRGRVRIEDPRQAEQEVDTQRAEDRRRESGRFIMEQEENAQQDENATLQLKDLINSLSPRKSKSAKIKGRKSFAIGSAKGLLGKRPLELDEEEEEEEDDGDHTPKRLKTVARESSPVKAIHLPKPPSKEETTGRLTKIQQLALDTFGGDSTPKTLHSPNKRSAGPSPRQVGRFKDIDATAGGHIESFEGRLDNVIGAVNPEVVQAKTTDTADEKVSLQDFLNMTNIHFIELSTTKRRHTMAQSLASQPASGKEDQPASLATSFVAAATTVPLLEMYQHATRELKSYISSGRKIVRSIEAETLAEQPPLFREYIEARPDVKMVMDNQFRNGKTNARLQSKEGWYSWRSQLVDGLRTGLEGIKSDMAGDANLLERQQASLDELLPSLAHKHEALQQELASLQSKIQQMESIDLDELKSKRTQLAEIDNSLGEKTKIHDVLQQEMNEKELVLSQAAELKTEMRDQIAEADRVREEYRGWPAKDVINLKTKVDEITKRTGWSLLAAEEDLQSRGDSNVALTMAYADELRLYFLPAAFKGARSHRSNRKSSTEPGLTFPISLTHVRYTSNQVLQQLPTEKRFFLQLIQSQLHAFSTMSQGSLEIKSMFQTVSNGWDLACKLSNEIRLLNLIGITKVSIENDDTLMVTLMLIKSKSRIDIGFELRVNTLQDGDLTTNTSVFALAIYGPVCGLLDTSRTKKVQNALSREIESSVLGEGAFTSAIQGFEDWYDSQAKPKAKPVETKPATVPLEATQSSTPPASRLPAVRRSPLAAKKSCTVQKRALTVATSRQMSKPIRDVATEYQQGKEKENLEPQSFEYAAGNKPAITPEMQEAMMQHTPIKRVGALRRSPIGGSGF